MLVLVYIKNVFSVRLYAFSFQTNYTKLETNIFPFMGGFLIDNRYENERDEKNVFLRQAASSSGGFVPIEKFSQTMCLLTREIYYTW